MVTTLAPTQTAHPARLRGLPGLSSNGQPTLLQRTEQDFLEVLFQELQGASLAAIHSSQAQRRDENQILQLYQPVHQVFHLVLLEAVCDPYDRPELQPRLDPKKIESAGLVIRRFAQPVPSIPRPLELRSIRKTTTSPTPVTTNTLLGWRQADTVEAGAILKGWVPFTDPYFEGEAAAQSGPVNCKYPQIRDWNLDPIPQRRCLPTAGNAEIDRQRYALGLSSESFSETYSPLFVAPPAVCDALGKTILYGLVPLSSSEVSEIKLSQENPRELMGSYQPDFVREQMPMYLKAGSIQALPLAGRALQPTDADTVFPPGDANASSEQRNLRVFVTMLRQLQIQLGVFADDATLSSHAKELFDLLEQISLPIEEDPNSGRFPTAGRFLKAAASILVNRQVAPEQAPVRMPYHWPAISSDLEAKLVAAAKAILDQQLQVIVPRQGRFADPDALYQLRAFMRVQRPDPCPPQLVWSRPSEPFKILSWYENGPLPPVQVQLPNVSRESVKKLKPNVTFAVPGELFSLLQANKPSDLLDGNGKAVEASGAALDWICGFNIPIITLCAFILLTIVLQLLNIIFWWLPYVYICIPFPKSAPKSPPHEV
ncbi:hypothetical protein ACQ4M4_21810 [Leptolyngbya sp. AN02str]|uniref:hypothetical protein n=1 Tax=Leptolyngbya sp. AN02str TaxID=3423363 RepID=UPI003D310217